MKGSKTGKRLRFLRSYVFNETQKQFAKRIGTTQQSLSSWESGSVLPPTRALIAIHEQVRASQGVVNEKEPHRFCTDWILGLIDDSTID